MLVLKCFITTAIVLQLFGVWYVCDREPYTGYWNYITAEHIPVIIKFRCLCFVFFEKIKHSVCWLNCQFCLLSVKQGAYYNIPVTWYVLICKANNMLACIDADVVCHMNT